MEPLLAASSSNTSSLQVESERIWSECPVDCYRYLHIVASTGYYSKAFKISLIVTCFITTIAIVSYAYFGFWNDTHSIPFVIFTLFISLLSLVSPFIYWKFVESIAKSVHICELMRDAQKFDCSFNNRVWVIVVFNVCGFASGAFYYGYEHSFGSWLARTAIALYSALYAVYLSVGTIMSMVLLFLYENRIGAFISMVQNSYYVPLERGGKINSGENEDAFLLVPIFGKIGKEYDKLHRSTAAASRQWGCIVFFVMISFLFSTTWSIWYLYERGYKGNSIVGYLSFGIFTLLEVGLSLTMVNERGKYVSNEISRFILRCRMSDEIKSDSKNEVSKDMDILLECIHFARIEIAFWDNFVFRSQDLLATLGSITAAVIPAFVLTKL